MKERRRCGCGCGELFICDKASDRQLIAGHKFRDGSEEPKPRLVMAEEPPPKKKRQHVKALKEMPKIESDIPPPPRGARKGPFAILAEQMKPGDSVLIEQDYAGALGAAIRKLGYRSTMRADHDSMVRVWCLEAKKVPDGQAPQP